MMPRVSNVLLCAAPEVRRIVPDSPATWNDLAICTPGHHLLYRLFDEAGRLLYVGITWSPKQRWDRHRKRTEWWPNVATATVECYPSELAALYWEMVAIKAESPIHNKRGVAA